VQQCCAPLTKFSDCKRNCRARETRAARCSAHPLPARGRGTPPQSAWCERNVKCERCRRGLGIAISSTRCAVRKCRRTCFGFLAVSPPALSHPSEQRLS
jgi:hypothetical protein